MFAPELTEIIIDHREDLAQGEDMRWIAKLQSTKMRKIWLAYKLRIK